MHFFKYLKAVVVDVKRSSIEPRNILQRNKNV